MCAPRLPTPAAAPAAAGASVKAGSRSESANGGNTGSESMSGSNSQCPPLETWMSTAKLACSQLLAELAAPRTDGPRPIVPARWSQPILQGAGSYSADLDSLTQGGVIPHGTARGSLLTMARASTELGNNAEVGSNGMPSGSSTTPSCFAGADGMEVVPGCSLVYSGDRGFLLRCCLEWSVSVLAGRGTGEGGAAVVLPRVSIHGCVPCKYGAVLAPPGGDVVAALQ